MIPSTSTSHAAPTPTAAMSWPEVWRRAVMPFNPTTKRAPCRDPATCGHPTTCDECTAWAAVLEEREADARAKWLAEGKLAPTLERVRRLASVYAVELAQIVRPIFYALLGAWLETVKGEAGKMLQREVARQLPQAAKATAGVIAAPDEVGRAARKALAAAMLPEIEDYLIEVVLGVLDAREDADEPGNTDADDVEADREQQQGVQS